jgi:hypothetical protein
MSTGGLEFMAKTPPPQGIAGVYRRRESRVSIRVARVGSETGGVRAERP